MHLLNGVLLCLTTLCGSLGEVSGDASFSNMKAIPLFSRPVHRRFRAADTCYDIDGNQVADGQNYIPSGKNACLHCKCMLGGPEECFTTRCAVPTCQKYKPLPGKCCAYTCLEENREQTELAIIVSLSIGLVLLLALLALVIHRNRKRLRRNREAVQDPDEQGELRGNNNSIDRPLNNQLPPIQEEQQDTTQSFEPPPPYTPARNIHKCKTHQIHNIHTPPNEPPPPYEIETNLRATPV